MSAKGRILGLLNNLVLTEAELTEAVTVGGAYRLLSLRSAPGVAQSWRPGDKVQVLLPDHEVRTLTPVDWERSGLTRLLVFTRDSTSLGSWAREAKPGDRVGFVGPQRSLRLPEGPLTLVGDETSIAVSASYALASPGQVQVHLEVEDVEAAQAALDAVGLRAAHLTRRIPGSSPGQALALALPRVEGPAGLTGGAELVKQVRARLREQGSRAIHTKAYWVPGRRGLD